ncbi:MAG: hypothetical protein PHT80_13500, partial [Lentisphaeria bacterium]|nr:hypothetical protein [Lentisphaeria bacterium]
AGMFRAFSASAASRPGKRARLTQPEALWLNYQWVTDYESAAGWRRNFCSLRKWPYIIGFTGGPAGY